MARLASVCGDDYSKLKFSFNTVTQRLGALRFFYIKILKKNWSVAETPYPRKVIRLPEILSPEEVAYLIDAAELPFYRILLMTLYGTGARRTEAAHLKVGDIDSRRMVVHIHGGRGTYTELSEVSCTCTLQFLIRGDRLEMLAHMRSNDAYLGLPNDVFAFTMIQELIAEEVHSIQPGTPIATARGETWKAPGSFLSC